MFDSIDKEWKETPIFIRFAIRIRNFWNFHKKEPYWFLQKIFRGYSDCDMWNLDHFLAKKIYKYLVIFKKYNVNSYCGGFTSAEDWRKALDKMIFSMHETANNFPGEEKSFKDDTYIEYSKKLAEGNELFGKYFNSLWD